VIKLREKQFLEWIKNCFCDDNYQKEFNAKMSANYYIQICPICGRRLEVKIEYIGMEVSCYHCRGRFTAQNSEPKPVSRHSSYSPSFRKQQDYYSNCNGYSGEENILSSF